MSLEIHFSISSWHQVVTSFLKWLIEHFREKSLIEKIFLRHRWQKEAVTSELIQAPISGNLPAYNGGLWSAGFSIKL